MKEWRNHIDESKQRWEKNAEFWNDYMGDESNSFHREIIRPDTEKLLCVRKDDLVFDIACGNGNFSKRLAELGAEVVAFDYNSKMIKRAKKRCDEYKNRISFSVLDSTDYNSLISLGKDKFDKAVANNGKKICLISNADIIDIMYWDRSPLNELFDEKIFSCEAGYLKPKNKIYEIALEKMNANPEKCIFIGDGGSDELKGAKEVGMKTILAGHLLKRDKEQHSALKEFADYYIEDFR